MGVCTHGTSAVEVGQLIITLAYLRFTKSIKKSYFYSVGHLLLTLQIKILRQHANSLKLNRNVHRSIINP